MNEKMSSFIPQPFGSYRDLTRRYGIPGTNDFEEKWIVTYPHVMGNGKTVHIQCNRDIEFQLHSIFEQLHANGGIKYLTEYDGDYVVRNIRGCSNLSMHAYGLAVDFNATEETLGSLNRLPDIVVDTFADWGFFYGGDFRHRKDPMHFEYTNGVI